MDDRKDYKNKKILIVEDNPKNMKLIQMILRSKEYTLLTATDGQKALEVAFAEKPDLIIMDIQIPLIDGLEVARKIKENEDFKAIPIIALTSYSMAGDKEKILDAGCELYLSKPVNTREFPIIVERYLGLRE